MKEKNYIKQYKDAAKSFEKARRDKFEAIKRLMILGYSHVSIAKMLGVSHRMVFLYYQKYAKEYLVKPG